MRVLAWGTYDVGKPRVRILLRGLRENGVQVEECHVDVWKDVEDKSQLRGLRQKLARAGRWLMSYPSLVWRYLKAPKHDVVLIGYLGLLDIFVIWPFAKIRGVPVVWDVFISLYNTLVEDRRVLGKWHPLAMLVYAAEYLGVRLADRVLMDTAAHAEYVARLYRLPPGKVGMVLVGAEPEMFPPQIPQKMPEGGRLKVLFYGQFIPLHGIETIVRAAKLCEDVPIDWLLVGRGQEAGRIKDLIEELHVTTIEWREWVDYKELVQVLHDADVALGIFGASKKASMVIPNKVYQILLAGRPLITGDTPAARELLADDEAVRLVPVENPEALAEAVREFVAAYPKARSEPLHAELVARFTPASLGADLLRQLREL